METNTTDIAEEPPVPEADTAEDTNADTEAKTKARRSSRARAVVVGGCAALMLAAAAAVALVSGHGNGGGAAAGGTHGRAAHTVPVGYRVSGHGSAQITYADADGRLHTVAARLPWHGDAHADTSRGSASLSIVLEKEGGTATCTITLHGEAVEQATAFGSYGRANCRAPLDPSPR